LIIVCPLIPKSYRRSDVTTSERRRSQEFAQLSGSIGVFGSDAFFKQDKYFVPMTRRALCAAGALAVSIPAFARALAALAEAAGGLFPSAISLKAIGARSMQAPFSRLDR
jgi:hypothetical protein